MLKHSAAFILGMNLFMMHFLKFMFMLVDVGKGGGQLWDLC